jgi:hypothetical protein
MSAEAELFWPAANDAHIDRGLEASAKAKKASNKAQSQEFQANKARAKELLGLHGKEIEQRHGAKYPKGELRKVLDQMAKWEPARFIKLVEQHIRETAPRSPLPAPSVLDAPESVADQNTRLDREAAQAKTKADREKLAERQAKPLTGSVGDIGATDMFDASKNDLFSAPAPKAKLSREDRIRLSQRLQQVRQSLKFLNAKNLPGTFGHGPVDHGNVEAKRASLQAAAADLERQLGAEPGAIGKSITRLSALEQARLIPPLPRSKP